MSPETYKPLFSPYNATRPPGAYSHSRDSTRFTLEELDPRQVVEGHMIPTGFMAEDVKLAGKMRETCPYCTDAPLQLVLRYKNVIRPHLFCEKCTRCFDAKNPDGTSALTYPALAIY